MGFLCTFEVYSSPTLLGFEMDRTCCVTFFASMFQVLKYWKWTISIETYVIGNTNGNVYHDQMIWLKPLNQGGWRINLLIPRNQVTITCCKQDRSLSSLSMLSSLGHLSHDPSVDDAQMWVVSAAEYGCVERCRKRELHWKRDRTRRTNVYPQQSKKSNGFVKNPKTFSSAAVCSIWLDFWEYYFSCSNPNATSLTLTCKILISIQVDMYMVISWI